MGVFGGSLRWIGAVVTVTSPARLHIHLPADFLEKVLEQAGAEGKSFDVTDVKRLAARIGWASTMIAVLRPFASSLWAAAADAERQYT